MGTRSLTTFIDDEGITIVVLYRQLDGHPSSQGADLARFLHGKKLVNGYSMEDSTAGNFNGMSCLAASVVAHFKQGTGGFYLYPGASDEEHGEEYTYEVRNQDGRPWLKALSAYHDEPLFEGFADDWNTQKAVDRHGDLCEAADSRDEYLAGPMKGREDKA